MDLNYSTAKTLIRRFKTRGQKLNKEFIVGCSRWFEIYDCPSQPRCGYQPLAIDNFASNNTPSSSPQHTEPPFGEFSFQQVELLQQVLFKE
jgi:hypothetical protein